MSCVWGVCAAAGPDGQALRRIVALHGVGCGAAVLALVQRRQVVCVPAVYQFAIAKEAPSIEASFGVAVTVLGVNKETDLLMVTVTEKPCARSNLEEAVKAVHQTILSKMGDVVVCVPAEPGKTQDTLFIMVDNSNMCVHAACTAGAWLLVIRCRECVRLCATCRHIGAQAKVGLEVVNIVHLRYAELMARVIQGRPTARKFAGGVMPDVVCRHWRQQGFSVRGGAKDDHGANIDDLLHAQILDTVTTEPVPGILVLLTGDGNINSGRTSFPRCVATALRLGWRVELYGWRAAMAMCYPAMAALSSGRMTVHHLDEWRREVCNGVPCHAPPWCVCESTLVCMWGICVLGTDHGRDDTGARRRGQHPGQGHCQVVE